MPDRRGDAARQPLRDRTGVVKQKPSALQTFESNSGLMKSLRTCLERAGDPSCQPETLRMECKFHDDSMVFQGGGSWIANFPPTVAAAIYQRFAPQGIVYDACAGWGGRLLGAYLGGVRKYIASTKEAYSSEKSQSHVRFPDVEAWRRGFLRPLLARMVESLRPGGHLLLSVTTRRTHRRAGLDAGQRKECKAKKTCQLKQPPPFWVQPPLRVLPQLTEIGEEEAWERMHYWGAVILLSPLLMAFLCEAMRWCFACAKRRISPGGKSSTASIASGTYRSLQMEESMPDLEKPFTETVETPPEPDHPSGCCCMLWIYHAMCAGLVAVGLLNGWISGAFGGGVAWELWVIWQQICLWNLFLQNLARCVMQDETALHASTVTSVLFYTTPFLSEKYSLLV
eukprot:g20837.t1